MRKIEFIVVHCTDTLPSANVESIMRYWKNRLGWKRPGYHYIIEQSGDVIQLLEEEIPSNGVLGYNERCVNVSYIGGKFSDGKHGDTRTKEQKESLRFLVDHLKEKYPSAQLMGHGEFPNQGGRTCPNFKVKEWYEKAQD